VENQRNPSIGRSIIFTVNKCWFKQYISNKRHPK